MLIWGIGGGVALAVLFGSPVRALSARTIVTSSSADKLERARELGADVAVDHAEGDVVEAGARGDLGRRSWRFVVETVGEATWERSPRPRRRRAAPSYATSRAPLSDWWSSSSIRRRRAASTRSDRGAREGCGRSWRRRRRCGPPAPRPPGIAPRSPRPRSRRRRPLRRPRSPRAPLRRRLPLRGRRRRRLRALGRARACPRSTT